MEDNNTQEENTQEENTQVEDSQEENTQVENTREEAPCEEDASKVVATAVRKPVYSQMSLEYVTGQMKKAQKKGMIQGLLIALLILGISGVIILGVKVFGMLQSGTLMAETLGNMSGHLIDGDTIDKTDVLYNLIESTYLEDTDKDELREGMYKGLLEALDDPYSVYYDEDEFAEMMEDSSGTFEGIGAYLQQDPETMTIKVVRPIKGSPAEDVGLLSEDIIVTVDGEDISGQDINLVVSKIKGPSGSEVEIGVYRSGEDDILKFDITRAKVEAESVEYEMKEDNIGYILVTEFADATLGQFERAVDDLMAQGMESLIIDLRSNGGGYVDVSVNMADMFVKDGVIVSVKDKRGLSYAYEDSGDDNYIELPIVILGDGNTASASEIFIGALRDYDLATFIGTTTFGKGITQDVIPLKDGTGVKITSAKYYSPDGVNIHGIGIEPDIEVPWDYEAYKADGTDNQLEAALNYLKYGNIEGK